jgi:hypothetical protein
MRGRDDNAVMEVVFAGARHNKATSRPDSDDRALREIVIHGLSQGFPQGRASRRVTRAGEPEFKEFELFPNPRRMRCNDLHRVISLRSQCPFFGGLKQRK